MVLTEFSLFFKHFVYWCIVCLFHLLDDNLSHYLKCDVTWWYNSFEILKDITGNICLYFFHLSVFC